LDSDEEDVDEDDEDEEEDDEEEEEEEDDDGDEYDEETAADKVFATGSKNATKTTKKSRNATARAEFDQAEFAIANYDASSDDEDYEDDDEIQLKNHKQKKHKEKLMDRLFTELQIPIFIAIVFFVFQMPIVNTMIFKRFSFLSIYSADGNFNFYGLFLKSLAFGFAYFALTKTIDYISDI
jgi:hypothetical protein